eukprot:TRINITY_DN641_c0_g1_i1.p1 TRINITY_DN641_c0_g1~~TRINITY_DN641_c0_g1_i1.p1  ORF type:complete len:553 (+),score=113.48 TRINITY_DN641_c0_g1_i1:210-1868(+)
MSQAQGTHQGLSLIARVASQQLQDMSTPPPVPPPNGTAAPAEPAQPVASTASAPTVADAAAAAHTAAAPAAVQPPVTPKVPPVTTATVITQVAAPISSAPAVSTGAGVVLGPTIQMQPLPQQQPVGTPDGQGMTPVAAQQGNQRRGRGRPRKETQWAPEIIAMDVKQFRAWRRENFDKYTPQEMKLLSKERRRYLNSVYQRQQRKNKVAKGKDGKTKKQADAPTSIPASMPGQPITALPISGNGELQLLPPQRDAQGNLIAPINQGQFQQGGLQGPTQIIYAQPNQQNMVNFSAYSGVSAAPPLQGQPLPGQYMQTTGQAVSYASTLHPVSHVTNLVPFSQSSHIAQSQSSAPAPEGVPLPSGQVAYAALQPGQHIAMMPQSDNPAPMAAADLNGVASSAAAIQQQQQPPQPMQGVTIPTVSEVNGVDVPQPASSDAISVIAPVAPMAPPNPNSSTMTTSLVPSNIPAPAPPAPAAPAQVTAFPTTTASTFINPNQGDQPLVAAIPLSQLPMYNSSGQSAPAQDPPTQIVHQHESQPQQDPQQVTMASIPTS